MRSRDTAGVRQCVHRGPSRAPLHASAPATGATQLGCVRSGPSRPAASNRAGARPRSVSACNDLVRPAGRVDRSRTGACAAGRCLGWPPPRRSYFVVVDRPCPGLGPARPSGLGRCSPNRGCHAASRRRSCASCSSRGDRWRTPRRGPTRTPVRFPAAGLGTSSTCRSLPPTTTPAIAGQRGCVVSKIAEFRARSWPIQTPRVASRRRALRFFVHLVQDLHQPMHVADRNDRGGNNLQVRTDATTTPTCTRSGTPACSAEGTTMRRTCCGPSRRASQGPMCAPWLSGQVEDWADESLELGRRAYLVPGTYVIHSARATTLGRRLRERVNVPLAVDRLARAGVRLAFDAQSKFSSDRAGRLRKQRTLLGPGHRGPSRGRASAHDGSETALRFLGCEALCSWADALLGRAALGPPFRFSSVA